MQWSLDMRFDFIKKLANYRRDKNLRAVGLKDISSTRLSYFNCSVSYRPCNWAELKNIKSTYSSTNNHPISAFRQAMSPTYTFYYISVIYQNPCGAVEPQPPTVTTIIPTWYVFMCERVLYPILDNTFYDFEDGSTKNLKLTFSGQTSSLFVYSGWLEFNSSYQVLEFTANAFAMKEQPDNGYTFSLIATDSTDLSVSTNVAIEMYGPYSILEECQIQMIFSSKKFADLSVLTISNFLVRRLVNYFKIEMNELGMVSVIKSSSTEITFSWSYCSSLYKTDAYLSNSKTLEVDYYNFIVKILIKLFQYDRKSVQVKFKNWFGETVTVLSVKTRFTGRCANLPPIVPPGVIDINMVINYGGYASYKYLWNIFYDFEDGWAYSLRLTILDRYYKSLLIDHWVNIDVTTYTIFAVVNDYIRFSSQIVYIFYIRATDTGGKYVSLKLTVTKSEATLTFSPFNITYELYFHGTYNLIYVNQSSYIINQIKNYFSLESTNYVLMRWFYSGNGNPSWRHITWSVADHTCSSIVLSKVKSLQSQTGQIDLTLITSLQYLFTIKRMYYQTTCGQVTPTPVVIGPITLPAITFCNLFTYKLHDNLFFDGNDGELKNLKLRLLDSKRNKVLASSWMQINTASSTIYGIAIRSMFRMQTTFSYILEATNSGNKIGYLPFNASIIDSPFTSDCPITMTFRYKYLTSTIVNLDILWQVVEKINTFYGDVEMHIKVLHFARTGELFRLVWSNCSSIFQFTTQSRAKYGLDESYRTKITEVFSKVVSINNAITLSFKSFMENFFEIISISASYCCIENKPITKLNQVRKSAHSCYGFRDIIPSDAFIDECDGDARNLDVSLHYYNGAEVNINNWLQIDKNKQIIYGVVTKEVRSMAPTSGFYYSVVATDWSGRSTNYTYIVYIITRKPFNIYFVTGFNNYYDETDPTALILYDIRARLFEVLDFQSEKQNIYIEKFHYPSRLIWSHCSLAPCTYNKVKSILQKLQKSVYSHIPSIQLMSALSPKVIPYYMQVYSSTYQCADTNITIIVREPYTITNQTTCGNFSYWIPDSLFYDTQNSNTRDFVLNMFIKKNVEIPETSWIQFDETKQMIYGVGVLSEITETSQFVIQAIHPKSGFIASTNVIVTFPQYNYMNKIRDRLCNIKIVISSRYSMAYDDVTILKKFMEILSMYLNVLISHIQIISYSKSSSDPTQWSIVWTDCELAIGLSQHKNGMQYYNHKQQLISLLIEYSQSSIITNELFKRYFLQNSLFTIVNITIENCDKPPNTPPKINKQILPKTLKCGIFEYRIPENSFRDEQDGSTRKLQLELLNFDGTNIKKNSWIHLRPSQVLVALPNNHTLKNQPKGGYRFLLVAKDKEGLMTKMEITINFDISYYSRPLAKLNVEAKNLHVSQYIVDDKIRFLKKIEKLVPSTSLPLFIADDSIFGEFINVAIVSCDDCVLQSAIDLISVSKTEIQQAISHEFPGSSSTETEYTACNEVLPKITVFHQNVEFCDCYKYNLPTEFAVGRNQLDLLNVYLRDENRNPLQLDSWVWYNKQEYAMEAFPKETNWDDQQYKTTNFTLWFELENTIIFNMVYILRLQLTEKPKNIKLVHYNTVLSTKESVNKPDIYFISFTIRKMRSMFPRYNISYSDFKRLKSDPFTFSVKWKVCTGAEFCLAASIQDLNRKLINDNLRPSQSLIDMFLPDYNIVSITSNCQNKPPKTQKELNITVKACGPFEYILPRHFAVDEEDGDLYSLTIMLKTSDRTPVSPSSWIQVKDSVKSIIAFPTESLLSSFSYKKFILCIRDKSGGESETILHVTIMRNVVSQYYESILTFSSLLPMTTSDLHIQLTMLQLISRYIGDNTLAYYRIIDFRVIPNTDQKYYMKYGNCSIGKYVCPKQEEHIRSLENKMRKSDGSFTADFSSYVSSYFVDGIFVRINHVYSVDRPPRIIKRFSPIVLESCCVAEKVCLTDVFADDDDDINSDLILQLTDSNVDTVLINSVLKLENNCLYAIPIGNIGKGTYKYNLTAFDRCRNSVTMLIDVEIKKNCFDMFGYQTTINNKVDKFDNLIEKLFNIRSRWISFFQESSNQLSLISFSHSEDSLLITFGNCSIIYAPCDYKAIKKVSSLIFTKAQTINQDLVNFMQTVSDIRNITEYIEKSCSEPPSPPPKTNFTKLAYNITFCRQVNISVAENVFYDQYGHNTRYFNLELLTSDGMNIKESFTYWLQIDSVTQRLIGYPSVSSSSPHRVVNLILKASNGEGAMTYLPICFYIDGEIPNLDYQLTLKARIKGDNSLFDIYYTIKFLKYISTYFHDENINSVSLTRNSRFNSDVDFTWSFCKQRKEPCDCKMIKTTQYSIKENAFQTYENEEFSIQNVQYQLYGQCLNTRSPHIRNSVLSFISVIVGQTFTYQIPENSFFDYEDGTTSNLTLLLRDEQDNDLTLTHWIKLNIPAVCGMISIEKFQHTVTKKIKYSIVAKDACGLESKDYFTVQFVHTIKWRYFIRFVLDIPYGNFERNCSYFEYLLQYLSAYAGSQKEDIYIISANVFNNTSNKTLIDWTVTNTSEINCNDGTVFTKKFVSIGNLKLNKTFVNFMSTRYPVLDGKIMCNKIKPVTEFSNTNSYFPWYLWLFIAIFGVFLLIWVLWICIPRLCPTMCKADICRMCCAKEGPCSSVSKDTDSTFTNDVETNKEDEINHTGDYEETHHHHPHHHKTIDTIDVEPITDDQGDTDHPGSTHSDNVLPQHHSPPDRPIVLPHHHSLPDQHDVLPHHHSPPDQHDVPPFHHSPPNQQHVLPHHHSQINKHHDDDGHHHSPPEQHNALPSHHPPPDQHHVVPHHHSQPKSDLSSIDSGFVLPLPPLYKRTCVDKDIHQHAHDQRKPRNHDYHKTECQHKHDTVHVATNTDAHVISQRQSTTDHNYSKTGHHHSKQNHRHLLLSNNPLSKIDQCHSVTDHIYSKTDRHSIADHHHSRNEHRPSETDHPHSRIDYHRLTKPDYHYDTTYNESDWNSGNSWRNDDYAHILTLPSIESWMDPRKLVESRQLHQIHHHNNDAKRKQLVLVNDGRRYRRRITHSPRTETVRMRIPKYKLERYLRKGFRISRNVPHRRRQMVNNLDPVKHVCVRPASRLSEALVDNDVITVGHRNDNLYRSRSLDTLDTTGSTVYSDEYLAKPRQSRHGYHSNREFYNDKHNTKKCRYKHIKND